MALSQFPVLPGLDWGVKKNSVTSTKTSTAASGLEYRAQNWQYPRWKFSLPYQFLRQYGSYTEWATLQSFILKMAGQFGNFVYNDPNDNTVTGQDLGVGDGVVTDFPLVRALAGFALPVSYCNVLSAVYLDGVLQSSGDYSLVQLGDYGPDTIRFVTAPDAAVVVSADFTFFFVCRFTSDEFQLNNFIGGRWSSDGITFESVK